jgi:NAD(P)H-dependent FMN reductase
MAALRVLVTAGSGRDASLNRRLAALAARRAEAAGAVATLVNLRDLALPLYDGDLEAAGLPDGARELRRLFSQHDALLLAAPEYNGFVTPLLVNALDWCSRVPAEGDQPSGLAAMGGKVVGLLSASPGALGGQRALPHLRSFLSSTLAMLVLPQTLSVGQAHQAFDDAGGLKDDKQAQALDRIVQAVVHTAGALRAA